MKKLLFALMLVSSTALAQTFTSQARVYTGYAGPEIAPFGAIVDLNKGEVLYVSSIISVLAPTELDPNCIYEFTYTINTKLKYKAITLVPPTTALSCGHSFPKDR